MKSIEFKEGELDTEALKKALFEDENDPRSNNYKRILIRPKINVFALVFFFVGLFACAAVGFFVPHLLARGGALCTACGAAAALLYLALTAKRWIVGGVKLYQRLAPDSVRNKCRFEPSCSAYMLQAVEKYGAVKGVGMGIKRLRRCNIHGGGYDYLE